MSEREESPSYPPLESCLVLDARLTSRKSLVSDIIETTLFKRAVEAESLGGGSEHLRTRAVDACFLGPGISSVSAASFVRQGNEKAFSQKCAFITFVARAAHRGELEAAGSHQVIQSPYVKGKLAELIVAGVIKADPDGAWAAIYRDFEARGKLVSVPTGAAVPELSVQEPATPAPVPAPRNEAKPSKSDAQRLGAALLSAAPAMKALAARVQSGELGLDAFEKPTPPSLKALSHLVDSILAGANLNERKEEFAAFFETTLADWFLDLCRGGSKSAADNLKLRLAELAAVEDPDV